MPVDGDVSCGDVPRVYVVPFTATVKTVEFEAEAAYVPVIVGVVVAAARFVTVGAVEIVPVPVS